MKKKMKQYLMLGAMASQFTNFDVNQEWKEEEVKRGSYRQHQSTITIAERKKRTRRRKDAKKNNIRMRK